MKHPWRRAIIGILLTASLAPAVPVAVPPLRIGVPWAPGSKGMNDLKAAARTVSKQTEGRVRVRFVEQHDLDSGPVSCEGALLTGAVLARISPDSRLFSLPLLFRSAEEVASLQAEMDEDIRAGLAAQGLVTLTQLNLGFAYIHSRAPIHCVEDLKAVRLWVPPGEEESLHTARSFGMTPLPMKVSDVRDGLRQGTVDAAIVPPLGAILLQWHTEFETVTDTPFLCLTAVVVLKEGALASLTPPDQTCLRDELTKAFLAITADLRQKEPEALAVLEKNGVERHALGDTLEQREEWNAWAVSVADRLVVEGLLPAAGLAHIRQALALLRGES